MFGVSEISLSRIPKNHFQAQKREREVLLRLFKSYIKREMMTGIGYGTQRGWDQKKANIFQENNQLVENFSLDQGNQE